MVARHGGPHTDSARDDIPAERLCVRDGLLRRGFRDERHGAGARPDRGRGRGRDRRKPGRGARVDGLDYVPHLARRGEREEEVALAPQGTRRGRAGRQGRIGHPARADPRARRARGRPQRSRRRRFPLRPPAAHRRPRRGAQRLPLRRYRSTSARELTASRLSRARASSLARRLPSQVPTLPLHAITHQSQANLVLDVDHDRGGYSGANVVAIARGLSAAPRPGPRDHRRPDQVRSHPPGCPSPVGA